MDGFESPKIEAVDFCLNQGILYRVKVALFIWYMYELAFCMNYTGL